MAMGGRHQPAGPCLQHAARDARLSRPSRVRLLGREVVKVRTRHRTQRAAEAAAARFRRQAANAGRFYLEDAIEVWSRDDLLLSTVHDFTPEPWQ